MNEPTKPNDGGPAFPTQNEAQIGPTTWHFTGLTKRELFAAMAMQGLCSNSRYGDFGVRGIQVESVEIADALLAELEKGGQSK